jgi:hypothetical protein
MLIIFAAAFGEIDLLKAGKIFQGSVAGFKQMFLYLQPLLAEFIYRLRKKVAQMRFDSYLCIP